MAYLVTFVAMQRRLRVAFADHPDGTELQLAVSCRQRTRHAHTTTTTMIIKKTASAIT